MASKKEFLLFGAAGLVCFAAILLFRSTVLAGIASSTADIEAKNLRIGQTYNLTEMGSLPFRVRSINKEQRIKITLITPTTAECKRGFEPVPDLTWVTITRDEFTLLPDEIGTTDITIKIPNDEKLLGRNFEIFIFAVTVKKDKLEETGAVFSLGVKASLRFTIAPKPPTEEELKRFEKAKHMLINIELSPNDLVIDEKVPIGRKVNIEKENGQFLKLVNTGEDPIKVKVRSVAVSETGIMAPPGWENGPDKAFLIMSKENVKAKPLEIKKLPFFINFPNDDKYRNKKYFFVVEVYVENALLRTSYRSKVYVRTK